MNLTKQYYFKYMKKKKVVFLLNWKLLFNKFISHVKEYIHTYIVINCNIFKKLCKHKNKFVFFKMVFSINAFLTKERR